MASVLHGTITSILNSGWKKEELDVMVPTPLHFILLASTVTQQLKLQGRLENGRRGLEMEIVSAKS